jgi:2'-5' RNA ligase
MELIDIDIVIAPPSHIRNSAILKSRQLKKNGTLFTLSNTDRFPHISVYMIKIPLKNLGKVQKEVKKIAESIKPFPVTSYRYRYYDKVWVSIRYFRNIHLRRLQKMILDRINPLREGHLMDNDKLNLRSMPIKKQRALEKYGFRRVLKEYNPHITLTKLQNQLSLPKMDIKLKWDDMSFTANKLAIYISGEYGTCRKLIGSYPLSV